MLVGKTTRMADVWLTDDDTLYWIEVRPEQRGRFVVMKRKPDTGEAVELTPEPFNVRTRVHEYGGTPFTVVGTTLFFSNYGDHRLYRQEDGQQPKAVTASAPMRYADLVWEDGRQRLIAIREDHTESDIHAVNTIVAIDPESESTGIVLVEGADFYLYPRISPDGKKLAWIQWNHPNMPWDGTELWVGDLNDHGVSHAERVAGGLEESVVQPVWSPEGTLYFVSDRPNWWNLYRWDDGQAVPAIAPMDAEFGQPNWQIGTANYGFFGDDIVAFYSRNGSDYLVRIHPHSGKMTPIDSEYTVYSQVRTNAKRAVLFAASPKEPRALVSWDPDKGFQVMKSSGEAPIGAEDISDPRAIEFPTENGLTAHAFFYPPRNHQFQAPTGEKPPLIVFSHGGPTGSTEAVFSLSIQYWTTRGFAVVDVNYGGSTGYGRAYRNRLYDAWGLVDVADCTNAARYLARQGLVDENRLAIRGGSAGGYTTLACLTFTDAFHVGASYYGVSDIGALARETHKFESRYMDKLVGPWPEAEEIYNARSPIMHAEKLTRPVIFFQGLDDKIVPPNQADLMVKSLKERGIPVAYLTFEGEGHGFVRAETVIRAEEAELYFYAQILGIELSEPIDPVPIDNWKA